MNIHKALGALALILTTPTLAEPTRLILSRDNNARLHDLLKFANPVDACNFFGSGSVECTFAHEYFAQGGAATIEFARFPSESTRAHLYSGGAVAQSTPQQLAAALDRGTTLNIPLNGVTLTGCFGTGIGCRNLEGLTTFEAIASAVQDTLNASPIPLGTLTGDIAPTTVSLNITVRQRSAAIEVNSLSGGQLYDGSYICKTSTPCVPASPDLIGQIQLHLLWAPQWYSLRNFVSLPTGTINAVASYGILTVSSNDSGSTIAAPMGISRGVRIGYVWECLSLCGQAGARWIVNNPGPISFGSMSLLSDPVSVVWKQQVNALSWGYFDVAQNGAAQPLLSTIGYATGSAAAILGLSERSAGYPGVPYSDAFVSSPGEQIATVASWLDGFRANQDSSWTSCEIDYPSDRIPDRLAAKVDAWAVNHPPIQCPASWVTTPPSTPAF